MRSARSGRGSAGGSLNLVRPLHPGARASSPAQVGECADATLVPVTTRLEWTAYLELLRRESAAFRAAIARAEPTTRVPTCPEWDADDLLWHLGEVQWFWSRVVGPPLLTRESGQALERVERPGDREGLLRHFDRSHEALVAALESHSPGQAAWSWAPDQTVGFSYRRQAHEAAMHRVDAELLTGMAAPIDAALAVDGVDEALGLMFGGDGTETPEPVPPVEFVTTDVPHRWVLHLVREPVGGGEAGGESEGGRLGLLPSVDAPGASVQGWRPDPRSEPPGIPRVRARTAQFMSLQPR